MDGWDIKMWIRRERAEWEKRIMLNAKTFRFILRFHHHRRYGAWGVKTIFFEWMKFNFSMRISQSSTFFLSNFHFIFQKREIKRSKNWHKCEIRSDFNHFFTKKVIKRLKTFSPLQWLIKNSNIFIICHCHTTKKIFTSLFSHIKAFVFISIQLLCVRLTYKRHKAEHKQHQ